MVEMPEAKVALFPRNFEGIKAIAKITTNEKGDCVDPEIRKTADKKREFTVYSLHILYKGEHKILDNLYATQLEDLTRNFGRNTRDWNGWFVEFTVEPNGKFFNWVIRTAKGADVENVV